MNDYIYFRRELDYLHRLYYLGVGDYNILNQYIPVNIDNAADITTVIGQFFEINDKQKLDISILLAALSMNKINQVFKRILLQIVAKDISLRMSGKALLSLKQILSPKELRYIFMESPSIESGFSSLLAQHPAQTIIEHFKHLYFKRGMLLNFHDRFKLEQPIGEVTAVVEKINIEQYLNIAINKILPSSKNLLTNFRIIS